MYIVRYMKRYHRPIRLPIIPIHLRNKKNQTVHQKNPPPRHQTRKKAQYTNRLSSPPHFTHRAIQPTPHPPTPTQYLRPSPRLPRNHMPQNPPRIPNNPPRLSPSRPRSCTLGVSVGVGAAWLVCLAILRRGRGWVRSAAAVCGAVGGWVMPWEGRVV